MRGWSLYQAPAMWSWDGALELEVYLRALGSSGKSVSDAESLCDRFHSAARTVGQFTVWDGDGVWRLTGLPDAIVKGTHLVFIVTQQRDDLTFIASELELPWLEEWRCPRWEQPRESSDQRDQAIAAHIQRARDVVAEITAERLRMN